ncbi:MAG: thiamine phosphate synthase [Selenomonadaceae bacterium]|nr:thiamine phosphate synthase [Selenomonadaceae bacterium]
MDVRVDVSAYLLVGPENTNGQPVEEVVRSALNAEFTCIQLRSKVVSARELIYLASKCANVIAELNKSETVALLIDDRLDVALAAIAEGIKVDGVHVGQDDISPNICRKYLGSDAIVGFTPRKQNMIDYVKTHDLSDVDYLGVGPLHESKSKPEAGRQKDGSVITRTLEELETLVKISPVPVVVGGGVTVKDLPKIAQTGANGFFVISAVAGAVDSYLAAKDLVKAWQRCL